MPTGRNGSTQIDRLPDIQREAFLQRKPAGAPPRTKFKPPDAAEFFAKTFPNLKLQSAQLADLQKVLDGRAAMKEIEEDPIWKSILSDDRAKQDAMRTELQQWRMEANVVSFGVPTSQVLTGDVLLKEKEGKANREAQFREQLYATMLTYPVRIFVAPDVSTPALTMKWGPADWVLPNDGGKVSFSDLMKIEKFSVAFHKANAGDQVQLLAEMAELTRSGRPYDMAGKKVGETYGYVYNSSFKVGPEIGRISGYYDDARGRVEMAGVKGAGGQIVLKNPVDNFMHVFSIDLKSTDLRYYDKKDILGESASGMAILYLRGSQVTGIDEIMTSDAIMLRPAGDSYGQGWGAPAVLNEYEKFAIGAVIGDGFEDPDAVMTFGQIVLGCVPVVGQIADARDVAVGIHKMWTSGGKDGKLQTALSMIGFIPLIGDGVKAAWKAGRKGLTKTVTKEMAKDLGKAAVKEGVRETAGAASKQLGEQILKDASAVAKHFDIDPALIKKMVTDLEELATKAAKGDRAAAIQFAEGMKSNLDAFGGNAGSLVGSMGGDWAKVAKMLQTSQEGALLGTAMESWRGRQFANLGEKVKSRVGDLGSELGGAATPKMARTGTPSFASDVDVSFIGPLSTQHRNAAIRLMEEEFGPGWRKLMDADIFADPARMHMFEDPLKKLGGKAASEAGKRVVKEAELNVFAKMLKDKVPVAEVERLAAAAGVDMAQVTARSGELKKLSTDYLANELRKGTPKAEVEKMAKDMHVDFADVEKHFAGGEQLYKQMELELDALHSQFALAEKTGDVAGQARIGEQMAAIQGKLNASIPGPYMTPGGGAKHVSRRERALRPDGSFVAMSPILGYTAVLDDLYMLMHALPEKEFSEKSAKGMAKYADRLLVTAGQFGVEMKGSKRALFDDIAGLLERARLEKDKPALEKAISLLDGAKVQLNLQLGEIIAGARKNATRYLDETTNAGVASKNAAPKIPDPTTAGFTEKTIASLGLQIARISGIVLRKELPRDAPPP